MTQYMRWIPGDQRPGELPEGCEFLSDTRGWQPEDRDPNAWGDAPRRWPMRDIDRARLWCELFGVEMVDTDIFEVGWMRGGDGWTHVLTMNGISDAVALPVPVVLRKKKTWRPATERDVKAGGVPCRMQCIAGNYVEGCMYNIKNNEALIGWKDETPSWEDSRYVEVLDED